MAQLYLSPIGLLLQQLSNIGQVLSGGLVNIYVAGTVNTPQVTYTDSTGTSANANPIVLNSAGRLANSNAPVSVWVPANTPHKMVLTDAAGNLLSGGTSMDNLLGIDDPTGVGASLSNPASGFGADLVANAMRSYDVVTSVRTANVPTLAAGQTLVIDIEGGTLVNDGNGGIFYWSATSVATDDGVTVIKPNAILPANPGRYLRQANTYGTAGTFILTGLGFSGTPPAMVVTYVQNGNSVIVSFTGLQGVSNSTSFSLQGWPIGLRGIVNQNVSPLIPGEDNSALGISAYLSIQNQIGGNTVVSNNSVTGGWTASGTKGIFGCSFSYVYS
jgi:hypothetical protein